MQPQPKIRDFRPGTPIYPVPYCPNAFLFLYNVKHERACLNTLHAHSKMEYTPQYYT